jgi:hypothetical protein
MSDNLRGKFFIFPIKKSEKIKSLLESRTEGMLTLAINLIMPIVRFKKEKVLPLNTIKSIMNLALFVLLSYAITSMKWIKFYITRDKQAHFTFNDFFIKFVAIKEIIIDGEDESYKCICTYFTLNKKLIGVISYSYRQTKK